MAIAAAGGINRSIKDLDRQRTRLNTRLDSIEQRYRVQFSALDTLIGNMTSTSNFLSQQHALLRPEGDSK